VYKKGSIVQVGYNYQSPNFGMAFKIPKDVKCPTDITPECIKKAQEALKNTNSWHLTLMNNGQPRIYDKAGSAFVSEFHVTKPRDNELKINTRWDGSPYERFVTKGQRYCERVEMKDKESAIAAYTKITKAPTLLDRVVEIVKVLEDFGTKY